MEEGYSICLNKWALDKNIKNELNLLLIISSLCAEKGYCWASNKYFADLFEIDEVSISRKIKKLEKSGYIIVEYEKQGCQVKKRYLRLTKMLTDDKQKCQSTINKNVKENITSMNITSNNNIYRSTCEEIIDYLNKKTDKHFRYTNTTIDKIKARFNEGFTKEEFITVIDKKSEEWLNTDFEKFLRPETLFGTKFEGYLNQKEFKKKLTEQQKIDDVFERFLKEED